VSSVQERPQAPFKTARVRPAADLSSLDMVLVILNFKPQRLVAP
jgi:cell shape-determining protein MreC